MAEYIKRDDVIKVLRRYSLSSGASLGKHSGAVDCAIDDVGMIEAANVRENVYGTWMCDNDLVDGEVWCRWSCSECGYVRKRGWIYTSDGKKPRANLCENCGAVMRRNNNGQI